MFHYSLYNQIIPIIISNPHAFALHLNSGQFQYYPPNPPPRRVRSKNKSKPANKAISNAKQNESQRTALKAGLQKSLDASNKGYEILKKMGYEEGKALGKDGCGITEPLSIQLKDNPRDRAGLGQKTKQLPIKEEPVTPKKETNNVCAKYTAPIKKEIVAKSGPLTKKEKQMQRLWTKHSDDIELLRLRLQAEVTVKSKSSDTMIIAQIAITNEPICAEIFEIIHQYLVNSLHMYKATPFPMFHDIANVDDEIKVVCEDKPSFDYLASCIKALSANLSMPMTTTLIPPIGKHVYWFSVQMQGLVSGPHSFLIQIKKHRFDLKPDRWIIVSQQPCQQTNKTNLQIITDEYSAMLLIYRHCLKLFVCMQEIDFTLRGRMPFAN